MKAIVSLFISAYQPSMTRIEYGANSLPQPHHLLLCDVQYGYACNETEVYKDKANENKCNIGGYMIGGCNVELKSKDNFTLAQRKALFGLMAA